LEFVYEKTVHPLLQDLGEMVDSERPALDKLSGHLRTLLEHIAKHARIFELLFDDDTARALLESSDRGCRTAACQRMADIFRQGITEGVFRPADPLMLANMCLGICRGVLETRPDLNGREQRDNIHHLIMGVFLKGIASEKVDPNWRA
jgi:hypothetical protein